MGFRQTRMWTPVLYCVLLISPAATLAFVRGFGEGLDAFRDRRHHRGRPFATKHISAGRSITAIRLKSHNSSGDSDNDSDSNFNDNGNLVDGDSAVLNRRLHTMRAKLLEEQIKLPPNPDLSPTEFVTAILHNLQYPDSHLPQSGFRTLVRSSSHRWKRALAKSIGAPVSYDSAQVNDNDNDNAGNGNGNGNGNDNDNDNDNDNADKNKQRRNIQPTRRSTSKSHVTRITIAISVPEDTLVSALATAITRPNNQFQILVQDLDWDNHHYDHTVSSPAHTDEHEHGHDGAMSSYALIFPGDIIDYNDGKCWLEAQLRHPKTGKLLAITGWSLIRSDGDDVNGHPQKPTEQDREDDHDHDHEDGSHDRHGAWLLDWLDWQDFRDEFRPGFGREEWMRICG